MQKTAIVIGATGLVGSALVRILIRDESFSIVKIFTRRTTGVTDKKIREFIIDFDNLQIIKKEITGDIVFSCLGTTLKQAGSKEAQYKVDYTYQFEFAKLASENGVKDFMLVSSPSANPKSMFFYTKIKGELEVAIEKLDFKKIIIIQPSVLSGERSQKRKGEEIGGKIADTLGSVFPFLKKYRSISGDEVAEAMISIYKGKPNQRLTIVALDELHMK